MYVEVERSKFEQLISQMGGAKLEAWINSLIGNSASNVLPIANVPTVAAEAQRDLAWLMSVMDQAKRSGNPFTAYAHCLCKVE